MKSREQSGKETDSPGDEAVVWTAFDQLGNFVSLGARFLARPPKILGEVRRGIEKLSPT
jgi:hypothetical protein